LWKRVKNLKNINSNIPLSWLNLKWIFNIYWELDNLTLGTAKASIVKSIKNTSSLTWQYDKLKNILKIDLKELNNKKVGDNPFIMKKQAIIQTAMKALTPWSTLNKAVKSQNPTVNLFDDNHFSVSAWITSIKWVSVKNVNIYKLKDLAKNSAYSNKVKIIFQSYWWSYKNSIWFYEENDGKPKDWKIVIKNIKKYSSWYVIYSWEIDKWLFIVSNGNLDKWPVEFENSNKLSSKVPNSLNKRLKKIWISISDYYKSKYKTKIRKKKYKFTWFSWKDWYTPIFFDNSSYNYNFWQASKIELYDWYALMKIEDKYKEQNKKYNMVFKIVPIK